MLLDETFMFQRGAHFAPGVDDQERIVPGVSTPVGVCHRWGGNHVASPALRMNTYTKLRSMYANASVLSTAPASGGELARMESLNLLDEHLHHRTPRYRRRTLMLVYYEEASSKLVCTILALHAALVTTCSVCNDVCRAFTKRCCDRATELRWCSALRLVAIDATREMRTAADGCAPASARIHEDGMAVGARLAIRERRQARAIRARDAGADHTTAAATRRATRAPNLPRWANARARSPSAGGATCSARTAGGCCTAC